MSRQRRFLVSAMLLVGPQALPAQPHWSPPEDVDLRDAYEIPSASTRPRGPWSTRRCSLPVPERTRVLAIDFADTPPSVTPDPVATGNIFALGALDENAAGLGFSFVDGSFDLRYGFCPHRARTSPASWSPPAPWSTRRAAPPRATTSSPRSQRLAAHAERLPIRNGVDWTLCTPICRRKRGVCGSTTAAGASASSSIPRRPRSRRPELPDLRSEDELDHDAAPGLLLPRQHAAVRAAVDTDVPYAAPVLDRLTDGVFSRPFAAPLAEVFGAYRHRETSALRAFELAVATQALTGPVELGPAPAAATRSGSPAFRWRRSFRIVWASPGPALPATTSSGIQRRWRRRFGRRPRTI